MPRRTFIADEKIQLARAWAEARARGMTQDEFARQHRTTARRVREFVAEHGQEPTPSKITAVLDAAIHQLQQMRSRLDEDLDVVKVVSAPPEPLPPTVQAQAGAPPMSMTTTRSAFDWDLEDE